MLQVVFTKNDSMFCNQFISIYENYILETNNVIAENCMSLIVEYLTIHDYESQIEQRFFFYKT
jgi:hypothetical protein